MPRAQDASRLQDHDEGEDVEEETEDEDVGITEQVATFDEVVVWEHGGKVDVERDAYVRGLGEWVGWAGVMHGEDEDEGETGESTKKA
jgi:ribonuclease H2 subunit C